MTTNLESIKAELVKLAQSNEPEKVNELKNVQSALEKLASGYATEIASADENARVEARAQELVKKAFLGFGEDEGSDESIIELIKAYIAENPEVAAALGLGTAGALAGGGIGSMVGDGDLSSVLAGAGIGGAAGGAAGYAGGEDLMNAFAAANPAFTNELIKKATVIKLAQDLGINPAVLEALSQQAAPVAAPEPAIDEAALIDELKNMYNKSASADSIVEELVKRAAYNDALAEVTDELTKEAAYRDALAEVTEEMNKKAALDELVRLLVAKK